MSEEDTRVKRVFVDTAWKRKFHACYDPEADKFFEVSKLSDFKDYEEIYLDSLLFPGIWSEMPSIEEAEVLKSRAYAFLRNAKRLFDEGEYDVAAFSIEQFCQLILKYKLLIKVGTYPRTHSLLRFLRELSKLVSSKELASFIELHRFRDNVPHKNRGHLHSREIPSEKI